MHRLLFIQMVLWSLVSAIPEEDLTLINQVELLSGNTYNLIIQNKLEFCTYAAKLVVDCKAANDTELERWQHWLDLSDAERINITEKAIKKYVKSVGNGRAKPYDHYIPNKELQESLNRCTKDAFGYKQSKYLQSNRKILKSFEKEAIDKMQGVTNATRQSDRFLFESFDYYVKNGNETVFMYFRSKIINYEDRALLLEVKNLAEETNLKLQRSYMKYIMIKIETIISCDAVNETELINLKFLLSLIKEKQETLTDDEFKDLSYLVYVNLPDFEQQKDFLKGLKKCRPGVLEEIEAKMDLEGEEIMDTFVQKASSKMHQVSDEQQQLEKQIFRAYQTISNPSNELKDREQKLIILRIGIVSGLQNKIKH